jgi:LysR family transcriptional regulator, chromosome initiation inhibitor
VELDLDQLRALSAAVTHGSLDAAAGVLHVTPSAVSQRLRALESAAGQVLLVRSRPVRPTPAGATLVRLARQVELLVADADRELAVPGGDGRTATTGPPALPVLPVAVNADSLATWVLPALASVAGVAQIEVHREDETRTGELLRDGRVVAAVTTEARPVAGCRATRLGALRYRPLAAPGFVERWLPDGPAAGALERAPVVVFDPADDLQHAYARSRGARRKAPVHHVPSSAGFVEAIVLGMGWGMLPEQQSAPHERTGALVPLEAGREVGGQTGGAVDVVLHWQRWALRTPSLDALTEAVLAAARTHLHT